MQIVTILSVKADFRPKSKIFGGHANFLNFGCLCCFFSDFAVAMCKIENFMVFFSAMLNVLKGRLLVVRLILLGAAAVLVAVGVGTIYAIGNPADAQANALAGLWKKQLVFAAIGLAGFLILNFLNYRLLGRLSFALYIGTLGLLCILLLDKIIDLPIVHVRNNARRWIQLPGFSFQPSEICKMTYIIALSWYLRYRSNFRRFKALIGPFVLTLVPMVLILKEPDLGTVMLMMPVFFVMLLIAGAKVKHLLIILLLGVVISPFLWRQMNQYQRMRISSVLLQNHWVQEKTEKSPLLSKILTGREKFDAKEWRRGKGFNLLQSKFAIASGGATGQGFGRGPFVKYNFLPKRHNDFIFAIIAHQWGFWGCVSILALYAIIIMCGLEIAGNNTDPFGRLLAIGIVAIFSMEVIVNISMTIGLMPITGLTLPLVSSGGTSLIVSIVFIGLLNNIGRCRAFTVAKKPFSN